jgi:hypothetical protein
MPSAIYHPYGKIFFWAAILLMPAYFSSFWREKETTYRSHAQLIFLLDNKVLTKSSSIAIKK